MKLSICLLCWDRDFHFIKKLLYFFKKYIHVDYEVVLIDNCEKMQLDMSDEIFKDIKYHKNETNQKQWISRNQAWQLAEGEFIWFFDGDDTPNIVEPSYFKDADILVFDAHANTEIIYDNFLNYFSEHALHNILVKRSLLEKVKSIIDFETTANFTEDTLLRAILYEHANSMAVASYSLYNYRQELSTISLDISEEQLQARYESFKTICKYADELIVDQRYRDKIKIAGTYFAKFPSAFIPTKELVDLTN